MSRLTDLLFVRQRHNWILFAKFALVGGSGVLVNMLIETVMNNLHGGTARSDDPLFTVAHWNFSYSMLVWIVGFLVANLTNFQLNRTWTFESSKHAKWWAEFWPFLAVGSVAALVGMLIKVALKSPGSPIYLSSSFFTESEGLRSREHWSQLIAIFVTMPVNFVVNKFWTFAAVRGKKHEAPMVGSVVAPEVVDDRRGHEGEIIADERSAHESADAPERS